jgi:RimJ/RimL family protein N-acetyltransferase
MKPILDTPRLVLREMSLDRQRVIALIRPENVPSQGVALKIGLQPELDRVQHTGFEHLVFSFSRDARKYR